VLESPEDAVLAGRVAGEIRDFAKSYPVPADAQPAAR
jgi:hypothetical protein